MKVQLVRLLIFINFDYFINVHFQTAQAASVTRRPVATVRPFLLRRGTATNPTGGSFKRRSLKLRRNTKEGKEIETECEFSITLKSLNCSKVVKLLWLKSKREILTF